MGGGGWSGTDDGCQGGGKGVQGGLPRCPPPPHHRSSATPWVQAWGGLGVETRKGASWGVGKGVAAAPDGKPPCHKHAPPRNDQQDPIDGDHVVQVPHGIAEAGYPGGPGDEPTGPPSIGTGEVGEGQHQHQRRRGQGHIVGRPCSCRWAGERGRRKRWRRGQGRLAQGAPSLGVAERGAGGSCTTPGEAWGTGATPRRRACEKGWAWIQAPWSSKLERLDLPEVFSVRITCKCLIMHFSRQRLQQRAMSCLHFHHTGAECGVGAHAEGSPWP